MATIISVANSKGGVGKSHLSANLSVHTATLGRKVLLIDADPQATSAKFANIRDADRPSFTCIELTQPTLHRQIHDLSDPYDYIFIDVGGRDAPVLRSALGASNIILVPMIASAADSWAADDILEVLASLAEFGAQPDVRVVLNMLAPTIIARDAVTHITKKLDAQSITLLDTRIRTRTAWPRSFGDGLSVTELEKSSPASQELQSLALELGIDNERARQNESQPGQS